MSTQPSWSLNTLMYCCPPVILVGVLLWAAWGLEWRSLPDVKFSHTQGAGWTGEDRDQSRAALDLSTGRLNPRDKPADLFLLWSFLHVAIGNAVTLPDQLQSCAHLQFPQWLPTTLKT